MPATVRALLILPEGPGPGGSAAPDVAGMLGVAERSGDVVGVTLATPTGAPAALDATSFTWVKNDSEDDWAYLATLSERFRPSLSSLSEGDIRSLGLVLCRHLRNALVSDDVEPGAADSLVESVVLAVRHQLAPLPDVLSKLCAEEPAFGDASGWSAYEGAQSAFEAECCERVARITSVLGPRSDLGSPQSLQSIVASDDPPYDLVLVPGGGEQVVALGSDGNVGRAIGRSGQQRAVVAAVGQGLSALLSVDDEIDGWPFEGVVLTGPPDPTYSFLDDRKADHNSVRSQLLRRGAIVDESGPEWVARTATDRLVVSGRNSRCTEFVCAAAIEQARRPR